MGGNPAALPLTLGTPILLFVLAAGVVRGWRWTRKVTLVLEALMLLGFLAGLLLGLLAALDAVLA